MFPGFLSEIEMAYKPTKFVDIDQNIVKLLNKFVRYRDVILSYDELSNILLHYEYLHREYSRLFDAYFDAQAEIHMLLIENKILRDQIDDNDNSEDNS